MMDFESAYDSVRKNINLASRKSNNITKVDTEKMLTVLRRQIPIAPKVLGSNHEADTEDMLAALRRQIQPHLVMALQGHPNSNYASLPVSLLNFLCNCRLSNFCLNLVGQVSSQFAKTRISGGFGSRHGIG